MRNNFFDIHAHVYKYPYPFDNSGKLFFPNEEELVRLHDAYGISHAALLVLANAEEYVPQSNGEVIDIAKNSNGRFVPFCNIDPRLLGNHPNSKLEILVEHFKKLGCVGMGEVLPKMDFDDPKLLNLYRATELFDMPLLFDMDVNDKRSYGVYDEMGLKKLRKCLEMFPNLKFIGHGPAFWSEFGTLRDEKDRQGYITYPIDDEGMIPKLMREYKNLYVDISAGSGYTALTRDYNYTQKFFNEFPDRIMYGTDICFADTEDRHSKLMNKMLDENRISEEIYDKIARENALKLLNLKIVDGKLVNLNV